ncbi:MAG: cytochrome b [Pseudomonadales bacterium]
MAWKNSYDHWGRLSRLFHWVIAILMIYGSVLVIYIVNQEEGVDENIQRYLTWIKVHKSVGLTVLILAVFRLWWLRVNPRPNPGVPQASKERALTHWVHRTFYALMFVLPMSGFLSSNSVGATTRFWGVFALPPVFPAKRNVVEFFEWLGLTMPGFIPADLSWAMVLHRVHLVLGYLTVLLIVLHIAAALWHHFFLKDRVLRNMLIGR